MVKNQHYVWRKYLTPWSNDPDGEMESDKRRIWVYRKDPKKRPSQIQQDKLVDVGSEKYFYDISGYTEKDSSVLRQFLDYIQKDSKIKLTIDFKLLADAASQRDFIENNVMSPFEEIDNKYKFLEKLINGDPSFYEDSSFVKAKEAAKRAMLYRLGFGTEEDNLSDEELFKLVGEAFTDEADGVEDLKYDFNRFFWMQYFRTPKMHNGLDAVFEEFKTALGHPEFNTPFYTNLMTIYFAEQISMNLVHNFHTSLLIFKNESSIPFITSDAPIMNLNIPPQKPELKDMIAMYYPVSPKAALLLTSWKTPMKNVVMGINEHLVGLVKANNNRVFDNAVNEVYADNEEILRHLGN